MVTMIATKAQTYDRRTIQAGDEFEADEAYAGTLVSLGRATRKEAPSTKAKPTTTKQPAEEKPAAKPAAEPAPKYKTRRLKAE